jgi:hypothetical protein
VPSAVLTRCDRARAMTAGNWALSGGVIEVGSG